MATELAGEVEAVGHFAVGDRVFGVNAGRFGAHAECLCMREGAPLAHTPVSMPSKRQRQSATVGDGALVALGCLRRVNLREGQRILIYGASGSIETAGVQLARKVFGAHVTAVSSTKNVEIVRVLGADEVIDRTHPLEQVTEATMYVETQQKTGNVVLTVSGSELPVAQALVLLHAPAPTGAASRAGTISTMAL